MDFLLSPIDDTQVLESKMLTSCPLNMLRDMQKLTVKTMKNKIQAFRHNMRSEKHCFSNSTHRNLNALEWISLFNIVKINISA